MQSAVTEMTEQADLRIPGEAGVWVLIFGDMIVFGVFFVTYAVYRSQNPSLYDHAQQLMSQVFGVTNTVLLLSSSWFVALAVRRTRLGRSTLAPVLFALAFACGVGFSVMKFLEYGEKIRAGLTLNTNEFYTFYYMFTGIHFVHVLIGMAVLVYLGFISRREVLTEADMTMLESGASFWHLVDILWIVLFTLLYLMK
jgi:nitric oxide reductase NorE protein